MFVMEMALMFLVEIPWCRCLVNQHPRVLKMEFAVQPKFIKVRGGMLYKLDFNKEWIRELHLHGSRMGQ